MQSRYSLLFTDVDGTILPEGGEVSKEDKAFIASLTARGIPVTIATGRCRELVYPIISALGLDKDPNALTVAQNGGHIFQNASKKTLFTAPLEKSLIGRLFDHAKRLNLRCRSYSENLVYFNRPDPAVERFRTHFQCECLILSDPASEMPEPPIKFMVIDPDTERIHAFYRDMLPFTENILRADYSSPTALEYTSCSVSKGTGLQSVCGYYALPVSESVAIGDSENDSSMIRTAGLGVAMRNALPSLKQIAARVTDLTCAQGGFHDTLKDLF